MAACWQRHITSLHIRAHTRTQTRHSPRICGHPPLASDKCYLPHREHMKKWFSAEMTERREGRANATAVRELQGASWIKWVCWDRQTAVGGQKVSRRRSELLSWEVTNWTLIGSWKCRKGAKRRRGLGGGSAQGTDLSFLMILFDYMHWICIEASSTVFIHYFPYLSISIQYNFMRCLLQSSSSLCPMAMVTLAKCTPDIEQGWFSLPFYTLYCHTLSQ